MIDFGKPLCNMTTMNWNKPMYLFCCSFRHISANVPGRNHDATAFRKSALFRKLHTLPKVLHRFQLLLNSAFGVALSLVIYCLVPYLIMLYAFGIGNLDWLITDQSWFYRTYIWHGCWVNRGICALGTGHHWRCVGSITTSRRPHITTATSTSTMPDKALCWFCNPRTRIFQLLP